MATAFPFDEDHYFSTPAVSPRSHSGGDDEEHVKVIQEKVGVEPTGEYDETTREAVLAYQKKNKLEQTGVVGPKDWKKITT